MKAPRQSAPLPLRLEPALRAWLESRARQNKRSMNGEVTFMLENHRANSEKREVQHG